MMGILPCRFACAALLLSALATAAAAQITYPQSTSPQGGYPQGTYPQGGYSQGAPPAGAAANPVCGRLEAQLAAIDRGAGADPARAEQTRRIEETLNKQQADLDRTRAQWQRLGCQPPGLFSIFANQPPQCGSLNNQINQMRAGIDRTTAELERSRHGADDEMQRQAVMGALAQNNCGPQYAAAAPQKGFFETLFGGLSNPGGNVPPGTVDPQLGGSGYRTLCVRTCDGYYFPISFSTSPTRFPEDEQTCQRLCPATEAALYTYRNPGEDVAQAVSSSGRVYKDLANAFRYRREFVASCSCKQAGQTWAEALGQTKDSTIERGDIVVTEERAKALSQPRPESPNRTVTPRADARKPTGNMPVAVPSDAPDPTTATEPGKRKVRTVGPTFLPAQ
jgi:hypothetical protein